MSKFKIGDHVFHAFLNKAGIIVAPYPGGPGWHVHVDGTDDVEGETNVWAERSIELVSVLAEQSAQADTAERMPDNPKKRYGDKKPPLHMIHPIAELHESAALHSGGLKYGPNNYIEVPVEAMTYVGAIKRHLNQWLSGERVDQKELVHHLGAIKACCTILLTAEACGTLIDNRPGYFDTGVPPTPCPRVRYTAATQAAFAEVEAIVAHLNALYPADKA